MSQYQDLLINALLELGVHAPGEPLDANEQNISQTRLNQMADSWNARGLMAFNRVFKNYTLTPNHQPHLIGPGLASPDFDTGAGVGGGTVAHEVRPSKIYGAAIIFNNVTPAVSNPIDVRDDDWWHNQRVKTLLSNVPTDLYYSPDFPNGSLYFWPVPNFAYGVELELRQSLSAMALNDTIVLPQGYELALTLSLAEELMSIFPVAERDDRQLLMRAARARGVVGAANSKIPRMGTRDSGLSPGSPSGFNYYNGQNQ